MKRLFRNFLSGMGTVLVLFPRPKRPKRHKFRFKRLKKSLKKTDAESLADDWGKIIDMRKPTDVK